MKISVDCTEPLQDVLRVVGAAYGVTLAVEPDDASAVLQSAEAHSRAESSRRGQDRKGPARPSDGRRKSAGGRLKVSNAELRSWARQNGYAVSDRGRLPAAIAAAHRKAN